METQKGDDLSQEQWFTNGQSELELERIALLKTWQPSELWQMTIVYTTDSFKWQLCPRREDVYFQHCALHPSLSDRNISFKAQKS